MSGGDSNRTKVALDVLADIGKITEKVPYFEAISATLTTVLKIKEVCTLPNA